MGIFSESPKSFKMDRNSPLASRLKSSISKKLLEFLGNYSDDVLSEYIIVLVCNGKHQIQAREDLEAFLGERSGEFVSWLWDYLLKNAHQSDLVDLLDPKDFSVISPGSTSAEGDLRSNGLTNVHNHGNGIADRSLAKQEKLCDPYTNASWPVPSDNVEVAEGIQCQKGSVSHLNGINTNKIQLKKQRSEIQREVGANENIHDYFLTQRTSRLGVSSPISTSEQCSEWMDKSKKVVYPKGNGSRSELLDFPRREMGFNRLPPIIERPHTRQICTGNVYGGSPPRVVGERKAVGEVSYQSTSRGSVWDRLGKPFDEGWLTNDKAVDAHVVHVVEKDQEVYHQHLSSVSAHNQEHFGSMKNEVNNLGQSCKDNNPSECKIMGQGGSTLCKLHAANNIRHKRHFGEIGSGPSSCAVSLVSRRNMDHQPKESSQDFKRLNSTSEAAPLVLISQVQDMKQKLHQIEMEMSKLRTMQLKMKKQGQPHVLPNSGLIKHSEEDLESRTVFVTNVHFAATPEALSLHFAKCGVVQNVVILTEKLNAQPKGSAYITFANKESVDKGVSLSGTSFFSRTLKVFRKAEEATVISTLPPHAEKPSQPQFPQINGKQVFERSFPSSRLQWRRERVSAPSEPKAVASAASQQQLSSSSVSARMTKTTASSTETPAAA